MAVKLEARRGRQRKPLSMQKLLGFLFNFVLSIIIT